MNGIVFQVVLVILIGVALVKSFGIAAIRKVVEFAVQVGIKLLAGDINLQHGECNEARDINIGYFAQHQLEQLDPQSSPLLHLQRLDEKATEQALRNFLGGFAFNNDMALSPVEPFSGGEKARLVLAMIVYQKPNLLLLDEPTNHLDLEMRHALSMALQEFEGAMIIVSHDRHLLRTVTDTLVLVAVRLSIRLHTK